MANPYPTVESLSNALLTLNHCASRQESDAIAHVILDDFQKNETTRDEMSMYRRNDLISIMQENLDLLPDEASSILLRLGMNDALDDDDDDSSSNDSSREETTLQGQDSNIDDNEHDGELIGEGECELCEREMLLTKHHLIPKSTHSRIEPRLLHAAAAVNKNDLERAHRILGLGLEHVQNELQDKSSIKRILGQTCEFCRPCHSAIHKTHDNMTLGLHYNTVDQLLQDEQIYKFCKWASKQKTGKYAVKR